MKKISTTDSSTIESVKMMINFGNDPQPVIDGICRTHIITNEFINEFRQYINEKNFTTSFRLTEEMANNYPEFFNEEIWKAYFIKMENNTTSDDEEEESVNINMSEIADSMDISFLVRNINDFTEKYNTNKQEVTNFITNVIRHTNIERLDIPTCISIMGINNTIDELLLKRVKDDTIRNQILLTLSIDDDQNITSAAYKYMGNEMKENTLGTENISFKDFVRVISQSKDIGWISSMLDRAISNEIEIVQSSESLDSEMLILINTLTEGQFVKLSKLSSKASNAFSYKIMQWVLMNKYFNEQELIEMKDIFKRAGCIFQLKKLAKDNGFDTLFNSI